jgi:hypothetical protein
MKSPKPRTKKNALIISLCVLPGMGHWFLGMRNLGGIIAASSLVALLYPLAQFMLTFRTDVEMTVAGGAQPELLAALTTAWASDGGLLLGGLVLVLGLWAISALDLIRRKDLP